MFDSCSSVPCRGLQAKRKKLAVALAGQFKGAALTALVGKTVLAFDKRERKDRKFEFWVAADEREAKNGRNSCISTTSLTMLN